MIGTVLSFDTLFAENRHRLIINAHAGTSPNPGRRDSYIRTLSGSLVSGVQARNQDFMWGGAN